MSSLEEAQADFDKKDKRLRIGVGVLITYAVLLLTLLAVQTFIIQSTIAENQKKNAAASEEWFNRYTEDNAKQHKVTQAYIRCIAEALLVPVSERKPGAFDECGIEARQDVERGGSDQQSFLAPTSQIGTPSSNSPVVTTTPPNNPSQPIIQSPVATAPPDPDHPLLVVPLPQLRIGDILQVGN